MLNKGQTDALVKHLRDIAVILESSAASSSNPATSVATKAAKVANKSVPAAAAAVQVDAKKRGRKPGAVADEERCENVNDKQLRCKNRATKGTVCGKHLPA